MKDYVKKIYLKIYYNGKVYILYYIINYKNNYMLNEVFNYLIYILL